jgi:hypothetical protein
MILKYGTGQIQSSQDDANFCLCQGPLAVVASWERSLSLSSKVVQKK